MFDIDVSTLETVGEFGSKSWGEACAEFGIKILQSADLPDDLVWGFSETYTPRPPAPSGRGSAYSRLLFYGEQRRYFWWRWGA